MRVNPYPMPDLLAALNQSQLEAQKATLEISSGRSVNVPADDPTAAALLVENNDEATFNAGYLRNLTAINGQLSTADSTLSAMGTALQRAVTLGVQGATGTLSDSDREAIAQEIQGIQTQVLSLANTSYQGHYLFAGTATGTAPYVLDGTVPSGVAYNGNDNINQVSIGHGYSLDINQPGSQLFSAPGSDVFLALNDLVQALRSNGGISAALGSVSAACNYLSAQRVFYGNAMNQVESQTTYLNAAKLQIAQQQNTLAGADLASAATRLASAQTDSQATLAAISKLSQMTLFDYLR
jgi:flagellar hook-associated protein 3 FlgL